MQLHLLFSLDVKLTSSLSSVRFLINTQKTVCSVCILVLKKNVELVRSP